MDVYLGGDDSRHANEREYSIERFVARGRYQLGSHTITGGYEQGLVTISLRQCAPSRDMLSAQMNAFLEAELSQSVERGIPWRLIGNQIPMARTLSPRLSDWDLAQLHTSLEEMRAITGYTTCISADFIRSRQGVWLKKNWFDATFNFCYRGSYPTLLPDYLASQATPFVFIDIGANQGFYSLLAVRSDLCIHAFAFEPAGKTHALLAENIRANSCSGRITAFRVAVSDQAGDRALAIKPGHSGAATLRKSALGFFAWQRDSADGWSRMAQAYTTGIHNALLNNPRPLTPGDPRGVAIHSPGRAVPARGCRTRCATM